MQTKAALSTPPSDWAANVARALCEEGIELSWQRNMRRHTAVHLHVSASLASSRTTDSLGSTVGSSGGTVRRHWHRLLAPRAPSFRSLHCTPRAQLDEAVWEDAWAEGRVMTTEQAVVYALERGNGTAHDTAGD